jgi:hypothetical protein
MIVRAGFRTFELRQRGVIRFGSAEDALNWLKHLGPLDSELISRFRELLTRYAGEPDSSRLSDQEVIQKLAVMLYLGRIVAIGQEHPLSSGQPAEKAASPAPAFPLSERSPRAPSYSPPPPANDPPTFSPGSAAAQAAALVNAAADGKPFCAECAVSKPASKPAPTPTPKPVLTLVELYLEWPVHLLDRLPDDFTLTLKGPFPTQQRTKSDASSDGDLVRFEFEWKGETKSVQLEASGNGQTVVLWQGQVIGDLTSQIVWEDRLHPLLGEEEELEIAGADTGGGTIPDDLNYDDLKSLIAGLV